MEGRIGEGGDGVMCVRGEFGELRGFGIWRGELGGEEPFRGRERDSGGDFGRWS